MSVEKTATKTDAGTGAGSDLTKFNADAWSSRLTHKIHEINVMLPLVDRTTWEGDLRQSKKATVKIHGPALIRGNRRGTTIVYNEIVPTREEFTVNDGSYFAFEIDSVEKVQSDMVSLDAHIHNAVVALSHVIEAKILSAVTTVPIANRIIGPDGTNIVLDNSDSPESGIYPLFCRARTLQSENNAPKVPGSRWVAVDSDTAELLAADKEHFVSAVALGDKIVQRLWLGGSEAARTAVNAPGFVGMMAGYMIYETPKIAREDGAKQILFGDNHVIHYAAQFVDVELIRVQSGYFVVRGLMMHDIHVSALNANRLVALHAAE